MNNLTKISQAMLFLILSTLSPNVLFAQDEEVVLDEEELELMEMSLEELLNMDVVTASNRPESLSKAPATIIVITEQEIRERGYFELYDVLNDLPGFDLSRAFGDDNYYAYSRGYRKTTSDQMLLMIDGIIMNNLYNNNMNGYAQYPMQSIKQIEIVYGPASAIYGPNAFSGVINMITKKGEGSTVQATTGQDNTNIIDINLSEQFDDLGVNFAGRFYQSNGPDLEGRTPLMQEDQFTNPYYWGDFAQTSFTGYNSPIQSNFMHPSIVYNGLTIGSINYFYESGLGSEFAGGTSLNAGTWQFKENTVYTKYEKQVGNLSSKTLLRYRRSDIPGSSSFLSRWLDVDTLTLAPGASHVTLQGETITNNTGVDQDYLSDTNYNYAEYWQANNASYSFYQDFTYTKNDNLTVNFGLKYDRRVLNRDYVKNATETSREYVYEVADVDRDNPLNDAYVADAPFDFPARPDDASLDQENHNTLTDRGAYVQVQYSPTQMLTTFTGLRYDYNSVWGGVWSPRLGVVATPMEGLVTKLFFGTAFLEPSARILYGGWAGSLSNDNLVPERMRTFEGSVIYTRKNFSVGMDGFYNVAPKAIGQGAGKVPINLGERRIYGVEWYGKYQYRNYGALFSKFRGDLYVSYINSKEDLSGEGDFIETGNMAPIKVKLILTTFVRDRLSLSFQNRYVSNINTVATNPLGTIDAYFVNDMFLEYNQVFVEGFALGIKVYNLFDVDYSHPGYRAADAGETSVNDALLNTSWYSSRLPQPMRTVLMNIRYRF